MNNKQLLNQLFLKILLELKNNYKRLSAHIDMAGMDILNIFPIQDHETLLKSMSNWDGDFLRRKESFEAMLYEVATTNTEQNCFATRLLKTLFAREYLRDYRWPSVK